MRSHLLSRAASAAVFCWLLAATPLSAQRIAPAGVSQQQPQCLGLGCSDPSPESAAPPLPSPQTGEEQQGMSIERVFINLPEDQKAIWTSPFRVRAKDEFWLGPLIATSAGLVGSDQHSMDRER